MALYDVISKQLEKKAPMSGGGQFTEAATRGKRAATGKAVGGRRSGSIREAAVKDVQQEEERMTTMKGRQMALDVGQQERQIKEGTERTKRQIRTGADIAGREAAGGHQRSALRRTLDTALSKDRLTSRERQTTFQINNAFENKIQDMATERGIAVDDIFEHYRQGTEELAFREDAAELEQLAFELQLRDDTLINEYKRIAKRRDFTDRQKHREELNRLILGDALALKMNEYGWSESYDSNQRQFTRDMANIDINAALDLAKSMSKAANTGMMIEGATEAGKGVAEYYGDTAKKDEK